LCVSSQAGDPAELVEAWTTDPADILAGIVQRPAWMTRAACRGTDTNVFFPGRGKGRTDQAIRICARCPVLTECRQWALNLDEPTAVGIVGGMTAAARRAARARGFF
jgi:WhiB family redox-sensing transcriptional regulator